MSNLHYKISDYCIVADKDVPQGIADKILVYHLEPLSVVQENTTFNVYPSAKSSWRPYEYEILKGRSGSSQHTFGERKYKIIETQKGATDITCDDFENNKDELLKKLIKHTDYKRFAIYKTFIHADYKDTHHGKRLLFISGADSKWTFKKFI